MRNISDQSSTMSDERRRGNDFFSFADKQKRLDFLLAASPVARSRHALDCRCMQKPLPLLMNVLNGPSPAFLYLSYVFLVLIYDARCAAVPRPTLWLMQSIPTFTIIQRPVFIRFTFDRFVRSPILSNNRIKLEEQDNRFPFLFFVLFQMVVVVNWMALKGWTNVAPKSRGTCTASPNNAPVGSIMPEPWRHFFH